MLCSFIPGRIRIRLLERPDGLPENIDTSAWPGVKKLTPNFQTGSFLLEYDPDVLDLDTITEVVEQFDPEAAQDLKVIAAGGSRYPSLKPKKGQAENDLINMGTTLLASVVTGFFGPKRYHVHFGLFFVGLAAAHAWRYRRRLKPFRKWTLRDILGLPEPPPVQEYPNPEEEEEG
ncbi:MAG: DUF4381 domain-containing protein [Deltaproteobacteria bacterium]|jgi:hypothetical protein|nr:DUF4381 domain-containing protein [Deltaproteobacteria bacterium]